MLQPLSISENTRPYDSCPRRALPSATTTNGGDALGHLSNAAWRHSVVRAETMSGPGPWARACPGRSPLSALVHRSHRRLLPSIRTSPQRPLGHTTPQSRLTCAPNAPSHVRCLERELPLDPLVILLHPSVSAQCGRVSTQALVYHPKSSLVNCDVDSDRSLQIRLASVFEQWSITRVSPSAHHSSVRTQDGCTEKLKVCTAPPRGVPATDKRNLDLCGPARSNL